MLDRHPTLPFSVAAAVLLGVAIGGCGGDGFGPEVGGEGPVASMVTVSPESVEFDALGQTERFTATVMDPDGRPIPNAEITWVSDNPSAASVEGDGLVRAQSDGEVAISAIHGQLEGRAEVTVLQAPDEAAFTGKPGETWAGHAIPPFEVGIYDGGGSLVSSFGGSVTLTLVEPDEGMELTGKTTVEARAGIAEFDSVLVSHSDSAHVLLANVEGLSPARSLPFGVWEDPVLIDSLNLSTVTIAIGGGSRAYWMYITNLGPPIGGTSVQAIIRQESVERGAGGSIVTGCGEPASSTLDTGSCTFVFTLTAGEDRGFVPGPAEAVFRLSGGGDLLAEVIRPITLIEFVPPAAPDASILAVDLETTQFVIDGAGVPYTATLVNRESTSIRAVTLQGYVEQGSASRGAGGVTVRCGGGLGELTPGECTTVFTANAQNSRSGVGVLVPGPAVFRLEMTTTVEGWQLVIDEFEVPITLIDR